MFSVEDGLKSRDLVWGKKGRPVRACSDHHVLGCAAASLNFAASEIEHQLDSRRHECSIPIRGTEDISNLRILHQDFSTALFDSEIDR